MSFGSRTGFLVSLLVMAVVLPAYAQRELLMALKFKNRNVDKVQIHVDRIQTEGSLTCSQPSDLNGLYQNGCNAAARDGRRNVEVKGTVKTFCPSPLRSTGACDFSFSLKVYAGSHKFSSSAGLTDTWNCPSSGRCLVEIELRPVCWQGCSNGGGPPPPWHPTLTDRRHGIQKSRG